MRLRGAPQAGNKWNAAALESAVRSCLEAHKITGVISPARWTMRNAIALLVLHGIEQMEVARRLNQTRNGVAVALVTWRKVNKVSLDAFHARIDANLAAQRARRRSPERVDVLTPLSTPKTEHEVEPDLPKEIYAWMDDIAASCAHQELLAQGKSVTFEEVKRLPESEVMRLCQDADVRKADERTRWGR